MGVFSSTKTIPVAVADLTPIVKELTDHFQAAGYQTVCDRLITGAWTVSITKGGLFKTVLGLQTALKIDIEPGINQTHVHAGIGIFGMHVIPAVITGFVYWPLLLARLAGIVQQSHLDDEAVNCVQTSLTLHAAAAPAPAPSRTFCVQCGVEILGAAVTCPKCGARLPTPSPLSAR